MNCGAKIIKKFPPLYAAYEKIGEGGFGQVYMGQNQKTGQTVAIKELMLNPDFDAEKRRRYIERFERETLLGSRLQHPNIVRLLDKGQHDDQLLYAVFEYVDGQTLKDRLVEEGPLSPEMAAEVMSQVLDALAHAHQQGVVHRDIKPANIMLTTIGARTHVKILDFGIGALTNEARQQNYKSITLTHETLGTPSYSAPEQLRGEPPTPKTDLYVWGLVFIECLTGAPAVSGSNLATIFQKQLNPVNIPLPVALAGHPVASLLRRVLNKKLEERVESALDVYQTFTQLNFSNLVGAIKAADSAVGSKDLVADQTVLDLHGNINSSFTERKQITALCVTLNMQISGLDSRGVDVTDAEIIQTLHQDQKSLCVDLALRFGALHVGTLGDTLLFYFGYPVGSDNDSRLCARAALELLSQLSKRNALLKHTQGVESTVRIGIHTGIIAVYPDTVPEGDTPNIAMTISRAAQKNQILCSENTRKILESYIEFKSNTTITAGVGAEIFPLFAITGERFVEAFGFLRSNQRHHSFVGREKELAILNSLISRSSSIRSLYVYGEAGIGKSRLVHEFRQSAASHNHYLAQYLPEFENSALHPILSIVKYKYSLEALSNEDAVKRISNAMEKQNGFDVAKALPLLSTWLGLSLPEDTLPDILTPQQAKTLLFEALAFLIFRSDEHEIRADQLLIVEDLHWSDPTSVAFFVSVLKNPIFLASDSGIIFTSRQPCPGSLANDIGQVVNIGHLNDKHAEQYISLLFDSQRLADDVLDLLISRTDNIPLFIEELVDTLKQKKLVHKVNGRISFVDANATFSVPANLRESLQQKLDSLGKAKDTAQLAAAIGRQFEYKLLKETTVLGDEDLHSDIEELLGSDLIFVKREVSGDSYVFKHALVRDAAYDSMPPPKKMTSHSRIAEAIENIPEKNKDRDTLLSLHWSAAEKFEKAIPYGHAAASEALKRTSSNEVISMAHKIEKWIGHLQEEQKVNATLTNYGLLTSAYMETKGWASPEVLKLADASIAILKSANRNNELASRLWWKMLNGIISGNRAGLDQLYGELEALIPSVTSINISAIKCVQGFYHFSSGDRILALKAFSESLNYYDEQKDSAHHQVYGFDIGAFSTAFLARTYADLDEKEKSWQLADRAIDKSRELDSAPSLGLTLMYHAIVHQQYNNRAEVKQSAGELLKLANALNLPVYRGYAQMQYDWSILSTENESRVLSELRQTGSRFALGQFYSFYADAFAEKEDFGGALTVIDRCLKMTEEIGEPYYDAFLYYKRGVYSSALGGDNILQWKDDINVAKKLMNEQGIEFLNHYGDVFIKKYVAEPIT